MPEQNLTVNMGYRGELHFTIVWYDQNSKTHEQTFVFRVYGEKPTYLTVEQAAIEAKEIFRKSERD
jgi:hypothetical protein